MNDQLTERPTEQDESIPLRNLDAACKPTKKTIHPAPAAEATPPEATNIPPRTPDQLGSLSDPRASIPRKYCNCWRRGNSLHETRSTGRSPCFASRQHVLYGDDALLEDLIIQACSIPDRPATSNRPASRENGSGDAATTSSSRLMITCNGLLLCYTDILLCAAQD